MLSTRDSQPDHGEAAHPTQTLVVSAGTTLGSLRGMHGIAEAQTLIVVGDAGLLGIVTGSAVRRCLNANSPAERRRWNARPIETLISTPLGTNEFGQRKPRQPAVCEQTEEIRCIPHIYGNELIGLSVDEQLFVNWHQIEPLLMSATVCPVTNLKSRAYFESCLIREFSRASRGGRSIGVLMFDVDHFKRINDLCGHSLGDAVLHLVAECIRSALRADDIVTRYAGDEFAAICIDCDPNQIHIPVSRIQQTIRRLNVPTCGDISVSLSIGAAIGCEWDESLTAGRLVEFADQCLYEAKAAGRNCAFQLHASGHVSHETPSRIREADVVDEQSQAGRKSTADPAGYAVDTASPAAAELNQSDVEHSCTK